MDNQFFAERLEQYRVSVARIQNSIWALTEEVRQKEVALQAESERLASYSFGRDVTSFGEEQINIDDVLGFEAKQAIFFDLKKRKDEQMADLMRLESDLQEARIKLLLCELSRFVPETEPDAFAFEILGRVNISGKLRLVSCSINKNGQATQITLSSEARAAAQDLLSQVVPAEPWEQFEQPHVLSISGDNYGALIGHFDFPEVWDAIWEEILG